MDSRGFWSVAAVMALLAGFMAAVWGYGELGTALLAEPPRALEVRPGEPLQATVQRLTGESGLRHPRLLYYLALVRGDAGRIKAGNYVLKGRLSPNQLLDLLVSGKGEIDVLTVPEGYALQDIARRLEQQHAGRGAEFLRLAHDPAFIGGLDLPFRPAPSSLEGLLFPETYHIYKGVAEATLLIVMVHEFRKRALPLLVQGRQTSRLTPYQELVLASIIEKETGVDEERPLVSAVFHNRLREGIKLGSDPTVIYGIANFDGNLTRLHLRTPTPYNTYTNPGLPPTPIANPGLASLKAALAPAPVKFLYFVSKGNGTHQFSVDYATHEKAVDRYQRHPNRRRRT